MVISYYSYRIWALWVLTVSYFFIWLARANWPIAGFVIVGLSFAGIYFVKRYLLFYRVKISEKGVEFETQFETVYLSVNEVLNSEVQFLSGGSGISSALVLRHGEKVVKFKFHSHPRDHPDGRKLIAWLHKVGAGEGVASAPSSSISFVFTRSDVVGGIVEASLLLLVWCALANAAGL